MQNRIVYPSEDIFLKRGNQMNPENAVASEITQYVFDRAEYPESGGIYAYFKDCPFPAKGFPFPQAMHAVNIAKRFLRNFISALTGREMGFLLPVFLLFPKKIKLVEKYLKAYSDAAMMAIEPFILLPMRMTECAREIRFFIKNFLMEMGISEMTAQSFADVFSTLIQYDDRYRLTIEDAMSETTKENLMNNPGKEIGRLLKIMAKREHAPEVSEKFNNFARLINVLLRMPRIKKSFKKALLLSDFKNFQLDDADRYHTLLREDYDFMGFTLKERVEMYIAWHSVFPPLPLRQTIRF